MACGSGSPFIVYFRIMGNDCAGQHLCPPLYFGYIECLQLLCNKPREVVVSLNGSNLPLDPHPVVGYLGSTDTDYSCHKVTRD